MANLNPSSIAIRCDQLGVMVMLSPGMHILFFWQLQISRYVRCSEMKLRSLYPLRQLYVFLFLLQLLYTSPLNFVCAGESFPVRTVPLSISSLCTPLRRSDVVSVPLCVALQAF